MTYATNLNGARSLRKELAAFGLAWPEAILARQELPTIPEPTEQEFVDAVLAAKGDPANDATVQTLINRMALIRFGHVNAVMKTNAERKQGALIPAAVTELSTELHHLHAKEVEILTETLDTIPRHQHVKDIRLEGLAPHQYETTIRALTAQHRAERIREVWGKIQALKGNMNPNRRSHRASLYLLANPTPDQYRNALKESPVDFPEHNDEWGILAHGWEVKLADSEHAAFKRLEALTETAESSRIQNDEAQMI